MNYSYPWLEEYILEDGLRLADKKDIAAMKMAAITGRGTKKDFVDLYFLLKEFKLEEILGFYNQKYFDGSEYLVLKSLSYFDDAEKDMDLHMLKPISWEKIKSYIQHCLQTYINDKG